MARVYCLIMTVKNLINSSRILSVSSQQITYLVSVFFVASVLPYIALSRKYLFFQTNDDFQILARVSGIFYGSPTDELIFVAPPLSTLMEVLYKISQDYSWYTILLLSTQFFSIVGYLLIFEERIMSLSFFKGVTLMILVSTPIFIFFVMFYSLNFTQSGIIASGVGTLLFIFGESKYKKTFGLILISLGILWRNDGSLITILYVISFILLSKIIQNKSKDIITFFRILLPVAIVSIISYGCYALTFNDWAPWLSHEKREYAQLKNVFTQLYGFTPTAVSASNLENSAKAAGLSDNDWALYEKYYFLDDEVFSIQTQSVIAENRMQQPYHEHLSQTFENLNDHLQNQYKLELEVNLILSAIIISLAAKYRIRLYFGFWIFLYLSYFGILLLGERLPERVFWPFTFVALASLIATVAMKKDEQLFKNFVSSKYINYELTSFVILLALFLPLSHKLFMVHQKYIDNDLWWKVAPEQQILGIEDLYYYEPDKPIVAFSNFYNGFVKTMDPMQAPSSLSAIWRNLIFIGWDNRTPEFNERIKDYGLTPDLFTSVAKGEAYLATWNNSSDTFEVNNVSIFLREHKNVEVIWEPSPFISSDAGLVIWRAKDYVFIK